ncbi:LytR/AlgR family response regulator transcription factor [Porcipelethomonas sp.]|uniref:LytR/AlgR family response regulator transcription factor n=1 Tax=Porcipelethomonas sp. TaxID=2981675 RepID=UPI003EFAEE60
MRFAIVDDSSEDRSELKSYILSYLSEHNIMAELSEFESAESFLFACKRESFQVVFLNIYMKEKSGMEAAQELFSSGKSPKIIFLSSSTEFFRQSYAVHAVYYLVKPIVPEEFELAMQFLEIHNSYDVPLLKFRQNNVERSVPTEKILYIDVQDHTTQIHTTEETISLSVPFRQLTEPLEQDERFLCCLRGVIVNMQHILGMEDNLFRLDHGISIPVNIRKKKQIGEIWRSYYYAHMGITVYEKQILQYNKIIPDIRCFIGTGFL